MRRLPNVALLAGFLALALVGAVPSTGVSAMWPADPPVTLLDLHPADMSANSDSGIERPMSASGLGLPCHTTPILKPDPPIRAAHFRCNSGSGLR